MQRVFIVFYVQTAEPLLCICERPLQYDQYFVSRQTLEFIDISDAGNDCIINRKVRVLGRAPNELDDAVLDCFQQRILLEFVPSVHLVYIENCCLLQQTIETVGGVLEDLLEFLRPRCRCIDFNKTAVQFPGDDAGQRSLAGAAWSEENGRLKSLVPYGIIKERAFIHEVLLPHEILQL